MATDDRGFHLCVPYGYSPAAVVAAATDLLFMG